jgi:8-oxo-dGTP pyrophosphatase MutT (NUDIX family)
MASYIQQLRTKVGHDLLLMTSVSIVVYDDQGRILLVRHVEGDVWVTPGGSVEPPESPADAAVREMWEETGLWVELVRVLGVYSGPEFLVNYRNGDQVTYQTMVFEGRVVGGVLRPDGSESKALAYLSQAELAGRNLPAWMQTILPDLFARRAQAAFQKPTWQPPVNGVRSAGMSAYVRQLRQKVGNDLVVTPSVWGLVFDDQGRLLLQRRADNGRWAGPAGAIDPHEPPSNAIVREAWEETGVLVEPTRVVRVFGGANFYHTVPDGDQFVNYGVVFACRVVGGQPLADGIEATAVDFFPLHALPTELMSLRWRNLIAAASANPTTTLFEPPTWQPPS